MKIISAGATDPGKKRQNNEDAFLIDDSLELFAVADGVGGHAAGEVASLMAVETLHAVLAGPTGGDGESPPSEAGDEEPPELASLRRAARLANAAVFEAARGDPDLSGMATTLTVLALSRGLAFLMHIGDSRAYLFRAGTLRQLTADHTIVSELVRAGALSPDTARVHPARHVITRAVGMTDEVAGEGITLAVEEDDLFLLCSDGLTDMLEDADISRVLAELPPVDAVNALINLANERGGADNITVIVVQVTGV